MRQKRPKLTEPTLRVVAVSIVFTGQPKTPQGVRQFGATFKPVELRFGFGTRDLGDDSEGEENPVALDTKVNRSTFMIGFSF